jgi:putative ABC transport system permease protein
VRQTPEGVVLAAVVLYAAILRLYPADFRRRCAPAMLRTFEEWCLAASARLGLAGFLRESVGEFASALAGAWRVRRPVRAYEPEQATRREHVLHAAAQDCRYAVRRLRRQPALVAFVVLTLGFAIAATATLFSVVDAVMLRPSPFPEADRLMHVLTVSRRGHTFSGLTTTKLEQWRRETGVFEAVEAYRRTTLLVTGGAEPQEVAAAHVSPGLAATLGVPPLCGRLFATEDARRGDNVVLVSERFARGRFGSPHQAVGATLLVNGRPHVIAGVMPAQFHFPTMREQIWLPLDPDAPAGQGNVTTLVRLRKGLTAGAAKARIDAIVARLEVEHPMPSGWNIRLAPGGFDGPDTRTRRTVLVLFGAGVLVLLTACANVANLLLSRAVDRHRELSIRRMLGAGRLRLFRELLAEGVLIGLACGAVGLFAAHWAIDALVALAPEPFIEATRTGIEVDGRVMFFGLTIAVLTGALCNVPPALRTLRSTDGILSGRSRTSTSAPFQRHLRTTLVAGEVALAVVLLIGAALMVRSVITLTSVDLGFNPDPLLVATIGLDSTRYRTETARFELLQRVARDVEGLAGVSGVAAASGMPPHAGSMALAWLETETGPCGSEPESVVVNLITPGFLPLLGIRTASGRSLHADDPPDAVVVSEALARRCGAASLTAKRLRLGPGSPWLTVVGTAVDVRTRGLVHDGGELAVYLPANSAATGTLMVADIRERALTSRYLIVRSDRPRAIAAEVKRILWTHDPDQPVLHAEPAAALMADSIRQPRFLLLLLSLFSSVALALAAAGIFGVLAYAVAQRANEFGIRMALGASRRDIMTLVVGQGVLLAGSGSAVGLGLAWAFSRVLAGLLHDVDPRDPVVFATVPALVFTVAVLASWIPAARALRVDPASALRIE